MPDVYPKVDALDGHDRVGTRHLAAPLESAALYNGPPSEGAELKPTSATGTRVSWELDEPMPGGVWVQCAYGHDALSLSRPLPMAPTICVAKYSKEQAAQPRHIDFSCR